MSRRLAALVVLGLALTVAPGLASAPSAAERLVLTKPDVGAAYRFNAAFSQPYSLKAAERNLSADVKRQLAHKWVAGAQSGFNGVGVRRNIVSTADVFRNDQLDLIVGAFERRYLMLSKGLLLPVPAGAPGKNQILIRGKMQSFVVLLYEWQHGRNVLSVWQFGPAARLKQSELFALARRMDAKAR